MSDYSDILSRKTFRDRFSEGLNKQADSIGKPMNKGQAATQNILRGFAAGFSNDREREAKLAELEEQYKQVDAINRELTMATGKNQLKKEKYNLFLSENYAGLMQLSDLMQKGEDGKVDILGPELFANFSKIMGEDLGKFQHYKNGYFNFIDKKGEPRTINGMNLLQPVLANLPDDQKQNFKGFLTPLQMKDIDRMYEEKQLKIDKYRAEIDLAKAHSKLYESQAKEVKLSDYDKVVLAERKDERKAITDLNNKYITDLGEKNTKAKEMKPVITEFRKVFTENDSGFGSSKWDEFIRGARKITGTDAALQRAEYLRKYYFPEIKGIAGNPNQKEWVDLTSKIVSASHNKEAVLQELSFLEDKYNQDIENYDATTEVLASTGNKVYHYDPQFSSMVEESKNNKKARIRAENRKAKLEKEGKIEIITPKGETKTIDIKDLELYIQNGAKKL